MSSVMSGKVLILLVSFLITNFTGTSSVSKDRTDCLTPQRHLYVPMRLAFAASFAWKVTNGGGLFVHKLCTLFSFGALMLDMILARVWTQVPGAFASSPPFRFPPFEDFGIQVALLFPYTAFNLAISLPSDRWGVYLLVSPQNYQMAGQRS